MAPRSATHLIASLPEEELDEAGGTARTENLDSPLSTALGLGWQVARLFDVAGTPARSSTVGGDLPRYRDLSSAHHLLVGLDQIDLALTYLRSAIAGVFGESLADGGLAPLPTTSDLRSVLEADSGGSFEQGTTLVRQAVVDLHVEVVSALTAADPLCGEAYELGLALAETGSPVQTLSELRGHLDESRVDGIKDILEGLRSVLPPHAASTVGRSLDSWAAWADSGALSPSTAIDPFVVGRELYRQCDRWRMLLVGDKSVADCLDADDDGAVARLAVKRRAALAMDTAVTAWPLLGAGAVLATIGIALMVWGSGDARIVSGLALAVVGVVLCWRTLVGSVGGVLFRSGGRAWDAAIEQVAATKVTVPPPVLPPALSPPPARHIREPEREAASPPGRRRSVTRHIAREPEGDEMWTKADSGIAVGDGRASVLVGPPPPDDAGTARYAEAPEEYAGHRR